MAISTSTRVDMADVFHRYGIELKQKGGHWWACCPVHQEKTPSCDVNLEKGVWHCFGCDEGGDGIALVMKRENVSFPEALSILGLDDAGGGSGARAPYVQPVAAPSPTAADRAQDDEDRQAIDAARQLYAACVPLMDSPAAWYGESRGVPTLMAAASGVRYHPDYLRGGPAVVFPVLDQAEEVTAVQGRFLFPSPADTDRPDKKTRGRLRGVFCTAAALDQREIIVTEAPIDSLSLAACGFPSIALLGTHYPEWLPGARTWPRITTEPAIVRRKSCMVTCRRMAAGCFD